MCYGRLPRSAGSTLFLRLYILPISTCVRATRLSLPLTQELCVFDSWDVTLDPPTIGVCNKQLEGEEESEKVEIKGEKEMTITCPIYYDGESLSGDVRISRL